MRLEVINFVAKILEEDIRNFPNSMTVSRISLSVLSQYRTMKKLAFITLLCICFGITVGAQPLNKAKYETMIKVAQDLVQRQDYYNALEWYEKAYEDRQSDSLAYKIAQLEYRLKDYSRAERAYTRVLRRNEYAYPEARFTYGRILKMNGKYAEAEQALKQFVAETSDQTLKQKAQIELEGIKLARELPEANGVTIENAGKSINTQTSEYSPTIGSPTDLYYSSFNTDEVIVVKDNNVEESYAKIYRATKGEKGWQKPTALDEVINREGWHNSNVAISQDGSRMYFVRSKLEGNELSESKIYMSRATGEGNWGPADEVQGVNGEWIAKHPAVGELFGKEVLFFVSNMDGGFGGFDIYYATLKGDGVYADPVNLGATINTIGDEETPFYREGTLYFSSDGHPTIGGFDIFYSNWNGTNWSTPINMGKGFNSSLDDKFFVVDKDGLNGFLTSNREGTRSEKSNTCCTDIYALTIQPIVANLVVGTFTEDKKPLVNATVQLIEMTGNKMGKTDKSTNAEGNVFRFPLALEKSFAIIASAPGYYPDTLADLNTVGLDASQNYERRLYLKALPPPPAPEPEFDTISIEEPILLSNIYYDLDDDKILPDAEQDLEYIYELMTQYDNMRIELGSHTDARGSDVYNEQLSQARSESARRWLVRRGISRSRIEAKGYGEKVPKTITAQLAQRFDFLKEGDVLTEDFIAKLPTPEQQEAAHRINRRTEFKIIEGPTSILIKTERLRKRTQENEQPGQNRNSRFEATPPDSVKIDKMSSLYKQENLKNVPIMQFEDRIKDFGSVKRGEKRYHEFAFTNVGDVDLEIDIVSACDCTTADWPRSAIKPGEGSLIKVTFDSTEKESSETIDIDIILLNTDPNGNPIIERIAYKYELESDE